MKRIYLAAALLFSVIVGCVQEESQLLPDNEFPTEGTVKFKAVLEVANNPETKTVLGTPEDNIYPVLWSEGDELKILTAGHRTSDGVGTKMILESGAGTNVGVFSGDVPQLPGDCKLYYAIYPYTASTSIGGEGSWGIWEDALAEREENGWIHSNYVVMSMPSVQKYEAHSFAKGYNPAIAITSEAATEETELRFKNICGLLQINLTGNIKVGKITLSHNGGNALWGTLLAKYKFQSIEPYDEEFCSQLFNDHRHDYIPVSVPKNLLILDCGDGVQLSDTPTDFYFAVPVETTPQEVYYDGCGAGIGGLEETFTGKNPDTGDDGFTIRVYDENGVEVYTKVTGADNRIVRSMIRKMPVVDIRSKTLQYLSSEGTANSYIVPPSTSATFYAEYRGNTTYPVGDIYEAEILWETALSTTDAMEKGSVLASATYDKSTGYITLNTGPCKGSALVSVKDRADNILWSWHIWVTDYNPDADGATDIYKGAELMDRNLGALNAYSDSDQAPGNAGLRYQWGRKDPIDEVEDLRYRYSPSTPFTAVIDALNEGNQAYKISKPTTRFASAIWLFPAKEWGKNKNENDPCPPGWQVADIDAILGVVDYITDSGEDWRKQVVNHENYFTIQSFSNATYPYIPHWVNRNSFIGNTHAYDQDGWRYWSEGDRFPVRCQRSSTISNTEVIDLSANGTANSYIVKPNKHYKFNASVKGNTNETVGAATRFEYIHMTENRNEMKWNGWSHGHIGGTCDRSVIRDAYYKDGYIYFSTSVDQTYGNVTLSVQDIHHHNLWSWHIWCVDYEPDNDYDVVEWGDETRKMMKMNLGALSNSEKTSQSLGLMYQWGRKDPYVSAVSYDSDVNAVFLGNHASADYSDVNSTLLFSIQNPHLAMEASGSEDGDWLAEPNNALWGAEKTVYDPCPPGWKVPSRPVWEGDKTIVGTFGYGLSMDNIWYPASGFRHYMSFNLNSVGKEGHYWYSTPATGEHMDKAYVFYFDDSKIDLVNHMDYKAQSNPVRCMMDESVTVE